MINKITEKIKKNKQLKARKVLEPICIEAEPNSEQRVQELLELNPQYAEAYEKMKALREKDDPTKPLTGLSDEQALMLAEYVEKKFGFKMPEEYLTFLKLSDGFSRKFTRHEWVGNTSEGSHWSARMDTEPHASEIPFEQHLGCGDLGYGDNYYGRNEYVEHHAEIYGSGYFIEAESIEGELGYKVGKFNNSRAYRYSPKEKVYFSQVITYIGDIFTKSRIDGGGSFFSMLSDLLNK